MAKAEQQVEKLNLFQKLLKIQQHVVGLGKDSKSFGYQYVSGSKVLEHVKPLMNQYGLLLKQEIIDIENTRQDYSTKNGSKSEILSKVMMRFTWIDSETGEKDENLFGANGQNDWEKGLGSALTYAERYFLLKYFHINTDEDDIDNPSRAKQSPIKKAITDAGFALALKSVKQGTHTKEQIVNAYILTQEQIDQL